MPCRRFALAFLVAAAVAVPQRGLARPGDLDPTFGTGGKLLTSHGAPNSRVNAVLLQPDGRIVIVGAASPTTSAFAATRLLADGTTDTSFGNGGTALTSPGGLGDAVAWAGALQADGSIVLAGNAGTSPQAIALVRYLPGGTPDGSFGAGGSVVTPVGPWSGGRAVLVQPDASIVVAGETSSSGTAQRDVVLVRYTSTGVLDAGFGTGGVVTTGTSTASERGYALVRQADGMLVVGGASSADWLLARYDASGALDPSFGSGGTVVTTFGGGQSVIGSLLLQPDGKLVAAGNLLSYGESAVARYQVDGTLDPTFGNAGISRSGTPGFRTFAVGPNFLQPGGRILLPGTITELIFASPPFYVTKSDYLVARLFPTGGPDTSLFTQIDFVPGGQYDPDYGTALPRGGNCYDSSCWVEDEPPGTFRYYGLDGASSAGITDVRLRPDPEVARISLQGKGPLLPLPGLPLGLPVRAQLQAASGACWEARYPVARQSSRRFRASVR